MEVKPIDKEQKFRTAQSGFSRYPTETRTCYQCGEKGHLSANCPQKMMSLFWKKMKALFLKKNLCASTNKDLDF